MKYREYEAILEYPNYRVFEPFNANPYKSILFTNVWKTLINQAFPDIVTIIEYSMNGLVPNLIQKSHFYTISAAVQFDIILEKPCKINVFRTSNISTPNSIEVNKLSYF